MILPPLYTVHTQLKGGILFVWYYHHYLLSMQKTKNRTTDWCLHISNESIIQSQRCREGLEWVDIKKTLTLWHISRNQVKARLYVCVLVSTFQQLHFENLLLCRRNASDNFHFRHANFSGQGEFLGIMVKISFKTHRKKILTRVFRFFFLLDALKNFSGKLNPHVITISTYFPKCRLFCLVFE